MLMGLALTAFQPEMDAQSRGNSRSSSTSRSTRSSTRPNNTQASRPKADISPADRNPSKPSSSRPSLNKPSGTKPSATRPTPDKSSGNRPSATKPNKPAPQPNRPPAYRPAPPRPKPRPAVRPIIVRPSYGTVIAANIAADLAWSAVRLSYYNTVANTYSQISENNQYIAEQNAIIAQNNATIAAQNQIIAQTHTKAQAAYSLANELGLVQSYAAAGSSYFYQDGVFYSQAADGQYYVIVPPAGALVETLPEDFDIVILNGKEYYRVDDTVYQMTISEGKPYFEVLGQMN